MPLGKGIVLQPVAQQDHQRIETSCLPGTPRMQLGPKRPWPRNRSRGWPIAGAAWLAEVRFSGTHRLGELQLRFSPFCAGPDTHNGELGQLAVCVRHPNLWKTETTSIGLLGVPRAARPLRCGDHRLKGPRVRRLWVPAKVPRSSAGFLDPDCDRWGLRPHGHG